MVELGVSWWIERFVFPLEPAGGIDEGAILLGKTRARQPVNRGVDLLLLILGYAG